VSCTINFEALYRKYNKKQYIHPDPLEFLFHYQCLCDREIVAMVASSLAYGNVKQILNSVSRVLEKLGPTPSQFLKQASRKTLCDTLKGFKHRFATGDQVATLLMGLKRAIEIHGSLYSCFLNGFSPNDATILPALSRYIRVLTDEGRNDPGHLIPLPDRGSACKRLNLFLRWMVRKDEVDPGGWDAVPESKLIVPVDTHMHRICLEIGFTTRRQADMRTALDITTAFKAIAPEDPVRYDFSLTRLGIRKNIDIGHWITTAKSTDDC